MLTRYVNLLRDISLMDMPHIGRCSCLVIISYIKFRIYKYKSLCNVLSIQHIWCSTAIHFSLVFILHLSQLF